MNTSVSIHEIIQSKLLSKAVIGYNGKILILAVFDRSNYYNFFFQFTARTKRSPRKAWKFDKLYYGVYAGMGRTYTGLSEFIQDRYPGCEYKVRYAIRKRSYYIFHERIAFPFRNISRPMPLPGQTFDYANSITSGKSRKIAYRR